jgi:ParB/RepB/Spo0J family partition protein
MKLGVVNISDINLVNRRREDYGDIDELARSIKDRGLINPITVYSATGNPPYNVAAGGRRFMACLSLEWWEIPCRIYDHPLTELELKSIELAENIHRKDLNHLEKIKLMQDIDTLQKQIHGVKVSTSPDASGHSMRDTADLVGKSIGTVSEYIQLAKTMEMFPQLNWDETKDLKEAKALARSIETAITRQDLKARASELLGPVGKRLSDSYILGDFFEGVKKIPSSSINFVEIDPPYAIDLPGVKKGSYEFTYGDSYNEVALASYIRFIRATLTESFRVMMDNSWLILWFGPEPWFQTMYELLIETGFKTNRMPGIWTKPSGQTNSPQYNLANCYEMFFYARKGNAQICKPGRSNEFSFPPVPPSLKRHPTERPLPLMEELLTTFTWEGSRVMVPYLGSGNTILAAKNVGMSAFGWDLSEDYQTGFVAEVVKKGE